MTLPKAAMNQSLSNDEYDALEQIRKNLRTERVSACIARNTKRLSGLKFIAFARDGQLSLTEKGQQILFIRRCILGLRAVSTDTKTVLDADVATFLGKKGHVTVLPDDAGYEITQRGTESLADIDSQGR
jgi:hypothetical protein